MANQQENQLDDYSNREWKFKAISGLAKVSNSCDHLAGLSSDLSEIPHPDTPCGRCNHPWENWLCLSCKVVLCGRFVNQHMLQHHQQTKHHLVLGYGNLDVWCYSCNEYVTVQLIPQLQSLYDNACKLKFGETLPFQTVEHVGPEDNQADGCQPKRGDQKEGRKRRRRRRRKNGSVDGETSKKSQETPEMRSNEGSEAALGVLSSSNASESNENDLKLNFKKCLCGQEAMIKISQSGKGKYKTYHSCRDNKCDFVELCCDNEAQVVDSKLPEIEAALRNQVVNLVDITELKAEVQSLTSRINMMEGNLGLMKMMILMNLFYGFMLMVVVLTVLFKH